MNTNLNMIETRTTASSFGRTNFGGIINNATLSNMKLQQLLASKNDAEIVEFEAATGWSWLSACTTALEADPSLTVTAEETFEQRFERETGWTYSDAAEMAVESRRDDRLFGGRRFTSRRSNGAASLSYADKFERETGWSLGDAIDMAAEARRDDRFFGNSAHGSHYLN
ncbi:hypothetical protein BH11CYA1_BH11CYA1_07950 [soil metagenome]